MTERELILVNRLGCVSKVIVDIIASFPEVSNRTALADKLNMSVKTVRPAVQNLKDLNVINEVEVDVQGNAWNKRLIINPETEWRLH